MREQIIQKHPETLLLFLPDLYLAGFRGKQLDRLERIINRYLPVYLIYTLAVIFIFPLIF
ncbi:MAG: hypothetical protein WCO93_12515 [bacterium]